jgi:hypothetical protein
MPKSDVIISLVSVFIGSAITFAVTYFGIFKSEKFAKLERSRERVATALLQSSKLLDTFTSYKPKLLYQSSFGPKMEPESKIRISRAIEIYDEAKYLQYLLPPLLRKRWDMMLVLISEFQNLDQIDDIRKNRALRDVQNYIQYVRESLLDYLDEKLVRAELKRPYLQSESVENWTPDSAVK